MHRKPVISNKLTCNRSQKLSIAYIRAHHLAQSMAVQSILQPQNLLTFMLILHWHLLWGFPAGPLLRGFSPKFCMDSLFLLIQAICPILIVVIEEVYIPQIFFVFHLLHLRTIPFHDQFVVTYLQIVLLSLINRSCFAAVPKTL